MLIEINEHGETLDGKWKLMPKEMTPEMIVAMARVRCESEEYAAAVAVSPLPSPEMCAGRVSSDSMSPYDELEFLRSFSIVLEQRAAKLRDQIQRTDR